MFARAFFSQLMKRYGGVIFRRLFVSIPWRPHKKCKAFYPSFGGMLEPENIFSLLKSPGLCVHKAGYGRSVSTALFPVPLSASKVPQCNRYTIVRQFLAVPAKLHALSGPAVTKAVVRFSLPGRQTNLRPGAVARKRCPPARVTKPLIRHVSPASCTRHFCSAAKGIVGRICSTAFCRVISGMSNTSSTSTSGTIRESHSGSTVRTACGGCGPPGWRAG